MKRNGRTIRPYQWIAVLFALLVGSCAAPDTRHQIVISTREQKLALLDRGNVMAIYPVSTSKFGLGDWPGSRFTPLGQLADCGENWRQCATGHGVQRPAAHRRSCPGQLAWSRSDRDADSLVAWTGSAKRQRISRGTFTSTAHPRNGRIGSAASYGCVRMRSSDIIQLYNIVGVGAAVTIVNAPLVSAVPGMASGHSMGPENTAPFVMR